MSSDRDEARRPSWSAALAAARAALIGLPILAYLWGRAGLKKTGLIEEWYLYLRLWLGGTIVPQPSPAHRLRPLSKVPQALAWALDPDSFVGLNLVHAALFAAKGLAAWALIRCLAPRRTALAMLAGVLFMVWPADTGLFATRAISPHFALVLFLVAACLLVRVLERREPAAGLLMVAALTVALLAHEVALPLALAFPVLLVHRSTLRRSWLGLASWYAAPFAIGLRLAYELTLGAGTYQRGKLQIAGPRELAAAMSHAYSRLFLTTWGEGWAALPGSRLLLLAAAVLPAAWLIAASYRAEERAEPSGLRLATGGLILVAVGFTPYWVTPLRDAPYTTLFASSFGAALCIALACEALARRLPAPRLGLAVIVAAVLALALAGAKRQHEGYIRWSRVQQRVLLDIAEQTGGSLEPGTVVALIGDSAAAPASWRFDARYPFFPPLAFQDSLRYVLGDARAIPRLCYPNHPPSDGEVWWSHSCRLGPHSISVLAPLQAPIVLPYDRLVAFAYDEHTGRTRLLSTLPTRHASDSAAGFPGYSPQSLLRSSPEALARARRLLRDPAAETLSPEPVLYTDILIDFVAAPPGSGWEGGPQAKGAAPLPSAAPAPGHRLAAGFVGDGGQLWTTARTATLALPMLTGRRMEVEFRVTHALAMDILDHLELAVDGRPVALTREPHPAGGYVFRAEVPADAHTDADQPAVFALTVPQLLSPKTLGLGEDARELGVLLEWFHAFVAEDVEAPVSPPPIE